MEMESKHSVQNLGIRKISRHGKIQQQQISDPHLKQPELHKQSDPHYNKQLQFILKQEQKPNLFEFPKIEKEVERIVDQITDQILKERNTILLAKLARESILQYESHQTKQTSLHRHSIKELQDPLILKSVDEINNFFCTEISTKVVKKIVHYLKSHSLQAKVMVAGIVIENPKFGFNIGGMCFWNNLSDGQKTIRRKIPALRGCFKGSLNQRHHQQKSSIEYQKEQFERQGLLVVTIYMCKFQRKFRNK